ncbi:hypothetical protein EPN15_01490 [Patescibacteria group bacterium]|nr:MAG: hypothetical protein EPN15_01490 [Patescibacteria group bacterium]
MKKIFKEEDRNHVFQVMFDCMINGEMIIFDKVINEARKKGVPEEYINGLEKSYEEYVVIATEIFREYGEKFSIKIVRDRIPQNLWVRLQKEASNDPATKAQSLKTLLTPWNEAQKKDFQREVNRKKNQTDTM